MKDENGDDDQKNVILFRLYCFSRLSFAAVSRCPSAQGRGEGVSCGYGGVLIFFWLRSLFFLLFVCSKGKEKNKMEEAPQSQQPFQPAPPRAASRALELLPPVNG